MACLFLGYLINYVLHMGATSSGRHTIHKGYLTETMYAPCKGDLLAVIHSIETHLLTHVQPSRILVFLQRSNSATKYDCLP